MSTRVQVANFQQVVFSLYSSVNTVYRHCGNDMQRSAHHVLVKGGKHEPAYKPNTVPCRQAVMLSSDAWLC